MTSPLFESFARDGEDVVLWRALGGVADGRVAELAADPAVEPSVTRALTDRGWTYLALADGAEIAAGGTVHALVVADAVAAESAVTALSDAGSAPWVVLVNAGDLPVGDAQAEMRRIADATGYELCLFDGVNGYLVHPDQASELRSALSYPAGSRDLFRGPALRAAETEIETLGAELAATSATIISWRATALQRWNDAVTRHPPVQASAELEAMRNTVSWRVTKPLRAVRRRVPSP